MNHWEIVLVLGVLLACKEGPPRKSAPAPVPGEAPSTVLARASNPKTFEGQKVKVTGLVVDSGGGTVIQCCGLEAGKQQLRACMKTYSCISGTCAKKAPPEGRVATLECTTSYMGDHPLLVQCVEVR